MKIKTSELTGAALDWAVAKCERLEHFLATPGNHLCVWKTCALTGEHEASVTYQPSKSWDQGGPIIEREKYEVHNGANGERVAHGEFQKYGIGPTSLIAAMRCHVASRWGDVVDIPEELLK